MKTYLTIALTTIAAVAFAADDHVHSECCSHEEKKEHNHVHAEKCNHDHEDHAEELIAVTADEATVKNAGIKTIH